jgi:CBS domain-containing protein
MKRSTPIAEILTTNCTIVEAEADFQTIRDVFNYFPNRFLPVVEGLRFIGVILREDFFQQYLTQDGSLKLRAYDLVSKEIVKLSPSNTLAEAKEVFDTKVFDVIPVVDDDGDLAGLVLREDVEQSLQANTLSASAFGLRKILSFLSL